MKLFLPFKGAGNSASSKNNINGVWSLTATATKAKQINKTGKQYTHFMDTLIQRRSF